MMEKMKATGVRYQDQACEVSQFRQTNSLNWQQYCIGHFLVVIDTAFATPPKEEGLSGLVNRSMLPQDD